MVSGGGAAPSPAIWVTGARGMLGREVAQALSRKGYRVLASGREADIRDRESLRRFAGEEKIDWVVNCAAYTDVDGAEDRPEEAEAVNAAGAGAVARFARELGAKLVHISTDYVFGSGAAPESRASAGVSPRHYREDDPVAPLGVYGATKAAGEALALSANPDTFVLRTAWLYGAGGRNFVATMLRLMAEREELSVVDDQFGSPTWTRDLAAAIEAIVGADSSGYGIYHACGEGSCSRFEFARAIRELALETGLLPRAARLVPVPTECFPTRAKRPRWSALSNEKLTRAFGYSMPPWRESLARFLQETAREAANEVI